MNPPRWCEDTTPAFITARSLETSASFVATPHCVWQEATPWALIPVSRGSPHAEKCDPTPRVEHPRPEAPPRVLQQDLRLEVRRQDDARLHADRWHRRRLRDPAGD